MRPYVKLLWPLVISNYMNVSSVFSLAHCSMSDRANASSCFWLINSWAYWCGATHHQAVFASWRIILASKLFTNQTSRRISYWFTLNEARNTITTAVDTCSDYLWSTYGIGRPYIFSCCLWSPYGIGRPYIFSCCGLFFFLLSFFLFFPRLISAAADWMSAILPHVVWP